MARYNPGTWDSYAAMPTDELVRTINILVMFGPTQARNKALATLSYRIIGRK